MIKKILLLFSFTLFLPYSYAAIIIFDAHGVLLEQHMAWWHIGPSNFLGLFNPLTIKRDYFNLLHTIKSHDIETPYAKHNNQLVPQLICDWLLGTLSPQEILTIIDNFLTQHKNIFESKRKRKLYQAIAHFMFNPEHFAQSFRISSEGESLFKKCVAKKHKVYILSNWDPYSCKLLYLHKKIKKLFDQCNGIIFSGLINLMKPDPAIFNYFFDIFNINPDQQEVIYIDDELDNINAANSLQRKKLTCLHYKSSKEIKKELKKMHIL